jgi:hypothetical protein
MGLLDKLQTGGSNLSAHDGKTPTTYNKQSNYTKTLSQSQLDLDGKKPVVYNKVSNYSVDLAVSTLDLNGTTPTIPGKYPYLDNLPQ